jgi:hypothetical protein
MKNLLMLAIASVFIFSSCTNNNSNPVNAETIPQAPVLTSPVDASAGIAVIPTLTWNASSGASSYTLQVSTNSSFSTLIYNQGGLTNPAKQVTSLNPLSIYYWRVNAANTAGTSVWSEIWSFTTTGPSPDVPILTSPTNKSTINSAPLTLSWIVSNGAVSYTLQVSADSLFTTLVYNQSGIITLSKQVTGLVAATYYWRVSATNNNGSSAWSNFWSITTVAPSSPSLSSPVNGAAGQPVSLSLSWSASGGATGFNLQVSLNSSFTSLVINQIGLTSLNYQISGLSALTTYYWRVSAINSYGTSGWSDTWIFTTQ